MCPHGQGGLSQCGILRTREMGQFFAILCGRISWTALSHISCTSAFSLNHDFEVHLYWINNNNLGSWKTTKFFWNYQNQTKRTFHDTRRITLKRVTSLRCPSSRYSAKATELRAQMLKRWRTVPKLAFFCQNNQSQVYMKHSNYFRDVSTLYLSHFQSVNKTTLNNTKLT